MKINPDAMKEQAGKAHQLLAAMANEKRLLILCQLIDGERSVNDIAELLDARQSTVSQHLALLRPDPVLFIERRRCAFRYRDTSRALLRARFQEEMT